MKFAYKRYPTPAGRVITRPVITITLRNARAAFPDPRVRCEALVDSGSDRCIFSAEIAELLGIDVMQTDKVFYVGGVVAGQRRPIYMHPVYITIGAHDSKSIAAEVGFMPDLSPSAHGLLGRDGFFDCVTFVKFKDVEHLVEIGAIQQP